MSRSKAITEKREEKPAPALPRDPRGGVGPSFVRQDEPVAARVIAYLSGIVLAMCGLAFAFRLAGWKTLLGVFIPNGFDVAGIALGVGGLLFHASVDFDVQIRRLYGIVGFLCLIAGFVLPLIPASPAPKEPAVMGVYLLPGALCLVVGLLFELCFLRHETDEQFREITINAIGIIGGTLAVVGFLVGNLYMPFLLQYGCLMAVVGLLFGWAYVEIRGVSDDRGYYAALGLGAVGLLVFIAAFARSFIVPHFLAPDSIFANYLMPYGVLFMGLGLLYLAMAVGMTSDNLLIVQIRRELAGLFYSPIAYLVLVGLTFIAWGSYAMFLGEALPSVPPRDPLVEPIVINYMWGLLPVIYFIAIVPLLTMRLMSEEVRSGTVEMLLTTPVNETTVVLGKFFAVLIFFLVAWTPWLGFLVDLRLEGAKGFDYRPLFGFFFVMTFLGANFLSMGLFFSSLSGNQIAAAVLTFAGMLVMTAIALAPWEREVAQRLGTTWTFVMNQMSYLVLWRDSLLGLTEPRKLLFHLSAAIFWLFLTVKFLESRKWR